MGLLIISIPLISSISLLLFGRYLSVLGSKIISISSILINVIIGILSLFEYLKGKTYIINIKNWFKIGHTAGEINIILDKESIIMINLISIITSIVIIFSFWYLNSDPHIIRFISKLLIFAVSMYILVSSKNILFTFLGWESVGIVSFLLINYWSTSIQNSKSALKAIIFNKIGDVTYLLGLIILILYLNTFDYNIINSYSSSFTYFIPILSISFLVAAMAKSAQIFLHCWLGDAMAGPTPVSALLHAATMVTAGIFLMIRVKSIIILDPYIYHYIFLIGLLTILFAGISALNQYDIKKIIAYSTCSQIGFMFFALGFIQPLYSSLYHLVTHGFFKALLFLSAGLLIHSFFLEQDIRKFGNFIFSSPLFYIFFFVGSLAIIAFPGFSGYYSKELILLNSLEFSYFNYFILFIGSIFSSFYSLKIIYFSFFNSSPHLHIHKLDFNSTKFFNFKTLDGSWWYIIFLFLLFGSIFLGYFSKNIFSSPEFLNISLEASLPIWAKFLPITIPFISFYIFFKFYNYEAFSSIKHRFFMILGNRKFFYDSFYNYFFVKPFYSFSYHLFYKFLDRGFLEYLGPLVLFRLLFLPIKNYNLSNQSIHNISYLFFYFFLSLFVYFSFLYFI